VGFCDDLKPAVTSIYEFYLVERVMTIFELSSGCMMHRTAASQKCKFLALGGWKSNLQQEAIPFDFFTLSDHLDFLGVTLKSTYTATRKANGDLLQDRVRNTIGPWRAGRFMPLNLRAHSVNCFAFSKLLYRCNVIDIRKADSSYFASQAKTYIYADLLEKPQETILYRSTEDGGLGLYNIQVRARAALIYTFLQTAIIPKFRRNHYHNTLFRHYILGEPLASPPAVPPHFQGDFFSQIRLISLTAGDMSTVSFKFIYKLLISELLRGGAVPGEEAPPLTPLRCELATPGTDWCRAWRLARLPGLGSELMSFNLKMLWGILPCRERVHRILPRTTASPACRLCGQEPGEEPAAESMHHALVTCPANRGLPALLLALLRSYIPGLKDEQLLSFDLTLEGSMELPLVWLSGSLLCSLWQQRQQGRVCAAKTRAELEARCRLLREGKRPSIRNAFTLAEIALRAMFG
jgi:hypothetical protein